MKIILYGGSFDPIHKGHIESAKIAFKKVKANKLFFLPTHNSPIDKKFRSSFKDRVNMIRLSISKYKNFYVSELEKKIKGKNYTWRTLEWFKNKYPNASFYILVGADQYISIEGWKNINYIRKNSKIICTNRQTILKQINDDDILIEDFNIDISSTKLISNINKTLIDKKVLKYINEKGLYWKERLMEWNLSEYRIGHSIAVANLAKKIASKIMPEYQNDLWIAGIYHDIAKDLSKEETEDFVKKYIKEKSYQYPSWKVLHPYIGKYILENYYCFNNKKILSAIENHTIMEDFSKFNKILFCADKLVNRPDDNKERKSIIKKITKIAMKDIDKSYFLITNNLLKL